MFLFFLKHQQQRLERAIEETGKKRKLTSHRTRQSSFIVMAQANNACSMYNACTKNKKGLLLSFVPFTDEFKIRQSAAKTLAEARKELRIIGKEISAAPIKKAPKTPEKHICKSKSDTEFYLQRKQYVGVLNKQKETSYDDNSIKRTMFHTLRYGF